MEHYFHREETKGTKKHTQAAKQQKSSSCASSLRYFVLATGTASSCQSNGRVVRPEKIATQVDSLATKHPRSAVTRTDAPRERALKIFSVGLAGSRGVRRITECKHGPRYNGTECFVTGGAGGASKFAASKHCRFLCTAGFLTSGFHASPPKGQQAVVRAYLSLSFSLPVHSKSNP